MRSNSKPNLFSLSLFLSIYIFKVFMVSVSFSLTRENQTMLSFCKKMFFFYPFLGFSHHSQTTDHDHHLDELHRKISIFSQENCRSGGLSGLSLLVVDGERNDCRPNVLESSSVKPKTKSVVSKKKKENSNCSRLCLEKKNHGSCTESLGCESSDQMEEEDDGVVGDNEELRVRLSWRRRLLLERVKHRDEMKKNQIKKFPPPLSSLNQNGKPNFILKPVRKDGRLELTEVPIDRPNEILRASRQDGRLRLHLMVPSTKIDEVEEKMIEHDEVEESEIQEMKFPLIGDGIRRCQEIGNRRNQYHHHHHMPIWKQHGVTTRSTVHVL